ncbi:hypothetical protein, partial [Mesorhizobium sp. M5C.F.Ca.IN.020.32.2.1]|uniref:hypothetical protein n=1 Tax=Mesorhizobium sp. M5C.F.Ca.IN.020.32.2.1 TaxID=2496771 RepID=UPI0019D43278
MIAEFDVLVANRVVSGQAPRGTGRVRAARLACASLGTKSFNSLGQRNVAKAGTRTRRLFAILDG